MEGGIESPESNLKNRVKPRDNSGLRFGIKVFGRLYERFVRERQAEKLASSSSFRDLMGRSSCAGSRAKCGK